jgi:hypothetical protein
VEASGSFSAGEHNASCDSSYTARLILIGSLLLLLLQV